jgi:hypothetical protein
MASLQQKLSVGTMTAYFGIFQGIFLFSFDFFSLCLFTDCHHSYLSVIVKVILIDQRDHTDRYSNVCMLVQRAIDHLVEDIHIVHLS